MQQKIIDDMFLEIEKHFLETVKILAQKYPQHYLGHCEVETQLQALYHHFNLNFYATTQNKTNFIKRIFQENVFPVNIEYSLSIHEIFMWKVGLNKMKQTLGPNFIYRVNLPNQKLFHILKQNWFYFI